MEDNPILLWTQGNIQEKKRKKIPLRESRSQQNQRALPARVTNQQPTGLELVSYRSLDFILDMQQKKKVGITTNNGTYRAHNQR